MGPDESLETQITCKFVTKLPADLRVPETPVTVPASTTRYGLSQIINHLLNVVPPRPFDFLVKGELVRVPLQQTATQLGVSAEDVLEVEYIPALLPPKLEKQLDCNSWIGAVIQESSGRILTGSYHSKLQLWDELTGQKLMDEAEPHIHGAIRALAPVVLDDQHSFVVGDSTGSLSVCKIYTEGEEMHIEGGNARYEGHREGITSISVSPDQTVFCSSSWDSSALLWATERETGAVGQLGKKRKIDGSNSVDRSVMVPIGELPGHKGCVSCTAWPVQESVVTAGWDHSIRVWDVNSGINKDTFNSSKVVLALATPSTGDSSPIAFGCTDNVLRLWDPRSRSGDKVSVKALASHKHWISCISWRPGSDFHLVTGSYDGSLKVWDIRATIPLHTLEAHTDKVLCVSWLPSGTIASGGEDCKLRTCKIPL